MYKFTSHSNLIKLLTQKSTFTSHHLQTILHFNYCCNILQTAAIFHILICFPEWKYVLSTPFLQNHLIKLKKKRGTTYWKWCFPLSQGLFSMEALYLKSTEVQQIQHLSLKFKPPINYWNTLLKEKKQRNHVQNLWSTKMLHHASEVNIKWNLHS